VTLAELVDRALSRVSDRRRSILGVTGPPGAGKTTFVATLLDALRSRTSSAELPDGSFAHVPMDGFHLADVQLDRLGARQRKGAPDTFDSAGYLSVLRRIKQDTAVVVYAPAFERSLEQPVAAAIAVTPEARLIVTEGNYLLLPDGDWPAIRGLMDEVWYVDVDEVERTRRLIDRHVRFGKSRDQATAWVHGPDRANALLVAATRDRADLVFSLADIGTDGPPKAAGMQSDEGGEPPLGELVGHDQPLHLAGPFPDPLDP
jgi:pantothenate kinase